METHDTIRELVARSAIRYDLSAFLAAMPDGPLPREGDKPARDAWLDAIAASIAEAGNPHPRRQS